MYQYLYYDFVVSSQLKMPWLEEVTGLERKEVSIKLGRLPTLKKAAGDYQSVLFRANHEECFIELHQVAGYHVSVHNQITVEPRSDNLNDCRYFLDVIVLPIFLMMKGYIVLSGGAVCKDGEVTLILGKSGTGKSSLLYESSLNGYIILEDKHVVIDRKDHHFLCFPGSGCIELWKDMVDRFAIHETEIKTVRKELHKYRIKTEAGHSPKAITRAVFLERIRMADFSICDLAGAEKYHPLHRSLYARDIQQYFIGGRIMFGVLSALAGSLNCRIAKFDEYAGLSGCLYLGNQT